MAKNKKYTQFAVLGLGRFGMSIIQTLSQADVNILACDRDETKLYRAAEYATHTAQADLSDEVALTKMGLGNFDAVILGMGEDFEASQIATMIAKEQGAKNIIVKARNNRQKTILEKIGASEVILPEYEMGAKLARKLINSNIYDILQESDLYTITEMSPMDVWLGETLQSADIRRKHNLTILAIRRGDRLIIPVSPDSVIQSDDLLITLSEKKK